MDGGQSHRRGFVFGDGCGFVPATSVSPPLTVVITKSDSAVASTGPDQPTPLLTVSASARCVTGCKVHPDPNGW